ncbi:MAG: hypothetical protein DCO97_16505, partial [Marivita sp. XM-24bin2]
HILQHYKAALAVSERPNVALFHYADMKRDLVGTFERLAGRLGVSHSAADLAELVKAASFENMKRNAARFAPSGGKGFFKSDAGFFPSGSNAKWLGKVSEGEMSAYNAIMDAHLTPSERDWLENGSGEA